MEPIVDGGYLKLIKKEKNPLGDDSHTLLFPNEKMRSSMCNIVLEVASGPTGFLVLLHSHNTTKLRSKNI